MTTRAIIQARMGGRRFPGKVLYDLCGKPVLKHVIDRVREAETVDEIVVATAGEGTEAIVGHCEDWGVQVFVDDGDESDVLRRFSAASADMDKGDHVVRVCADNPLIEPDGIDELVTVATQGRAKFGYVGYWTEADGWLIRKPTGYFAEVIRVNALRVADARIIGGTGFAAKWREDVTAPIYNTPHLFTCRRVDPPAWLYDGRPLDMAIDTHEDLKRVAEYLDNGTSDETIEAVH
jgi:spore coat polysaccharide biosynthesis protein SpsF